MFSCSPSLCLCLMIVYGFLSPFLFLLHLVVAFTLNSKWFCSNDWIFVLKKEKNDITERWEMWSSFGPLNCPLPTLNLKYQLSSRHSASLSAHFDRLFASRMCFGSASKIQPFVHFCLHSENETIQISFILVSFFLSFLTAWNVYWQSKMAIVTYQLLGLRPMQITLVMLTVSIHLVSHILVSLDLVWPSWCTLIGVVRRTSQAL